MRKKLLGTSALLAMFASFAGTVSAEQVPTLTLSGNSKFQAYAFKNTSNEVLARSARSGSGLGYMFTQSGEIAFTVAGVAANGLEYNYVIILNGDANRDANRISENRIEFKGSWGAVHLGNKVGPLDVLMVDPVNVIGGTGGFDGDWATVFRSTAGVFTGESLLADTGTATRVSYYTPRYAGFILGVGFAPQSNHKGGMAIADTTNNGVYINHGVLSAALNYTHDFANGVGFGATIGGVSASRTKSGRNDSENNALFKDARRMQGWQAGALLNYKEWQLAAGYLDNLKSGTIKSDVGHDGGSGWSAALGYTFNQGTKVSLGWQGTEKKIGATRGKGKADIVSVTADHTFAPGLAVYGEWDSLNFRVPQASLTDTTSPTLVQRSAFIGGGDRGSNKGNVFILGTKISF